MNSLTPYMECGYYPHVQAGWKARFKVAWLILRHGIFFPQPPDWYERLFNLVMGPLGTCARRAVEKAEAEHARHKSTASHRLNEAHQWARTYAKEAGLDPHTHRPGTYNFLIEFWAAHTSGKF